MAPKRILLVEDDAALQQDICNIIRMCVEDTECVTASTLQEGIRKFRENIGRLHAVVLDHNLDIEETTMSLYQEIREQNFRFAEERVASHSSSNPRSIEEEYRDAGLEDPKIFIMKGRLQMLINFLEGLPAIDDKENVSQNEHFQYSCPMSVIALTKRIQELALDWVGESAQDVLIEAALRSCSHNAAQLISKGQSPKDVAGSMAVAAIQLVDRCRIMDGKKRTPEQELAFRADERDVLAHNAIINILLTCEHELRR